MIMLVLAFYKQKPQLFTNVKMFEGCNYVIQPMSRHLVANNPYACFPFRKLNNKTNE